MIEEVEKELAAARTPEPLRRTSSSEPDGPLDSSTNIIAQMRKKIRLQKEQEVILWAEML